MVLQTQRCPGTAVPHHHGPTCQQQSYSTYQETGGRIQDGGYTNFSTITGPTPPYLNYSQVSTYSSDNSQHHQSGGGYHGYGAPQYSGGGVVASGQPHTGRYETFYHGNSQSHGHGNGPTYGYQKESWTIKDLDD
ncbi:hypothetical protein Lser_V15G10645 [Lactuca serriola]|uniref:Uncharacterized protein n=1 Tax=Lactuca sativa TaxID=4236 RepID=A0A9R1XLX8_LACSA|nr:hypothetical protein LSAT_V11C300112700 [Lactuca sativa]